MSNRIVEIPEMLNVPEKLRPVLARINDYRYFLLEGGRGGAKTQTVARDILWLGEQLKLRVVCGRETQTSINESVYSVFVDLIVKHNLMYDISASKITHKETGTDINFRGFREQGRFNIQGMEGIDILWIDESQAITQQTLDVLIPTIRKNQAKIFFTMNRHVEHDPVYVFCEGRDDCLHIQINYYENNFCTDALKKEAEECKKKSDQDYRHIWLGMPLTKSEDSLFSYQELKATQVNKHPALPTYGYRLAGYDIARFGDDKCTAEVIQQMGALHWEEVFADEWEKKDLNYTTGRILMTTNEQDVGKAKIDEDGIGSGPLDTLNKGRGDERFEGFRNPTLGYKEDKEYGNPRTRNAYKLKKMVDDGHIAINNEQTIKELCTLKYTYDHQQRKILISKKVMKEKFKVKSPNLADAIIMAVSLIGEVEYTQKKQYYNQPEVQPEEDIMKIAGIR